MFEESSCQNCEEIQEEIQHHKLSDTSIRTDDSGQFSGSRCFSVGICKYKTGYKSHELL